MFEVAMDIHSAVQESAETAYIAHTKQYSTLTIIFCLCAMSDSTQHTPCRVLLFASSDVYTVHLKMWKSMMYTWYYLTV